MRTYAQDSSKVATHPFYPLLTFEKRWTSYAAKGQVGAVKQRTIKYASRRDAAIFSYYRHLLAIPYEARLKEAGIEADVLAYRRVRGPDGKGRCNIDFALDIFETIRAYSNCCVAALDISSFFDCLQHGELKRRWKDLINCSELPDDHYAVFKHLTRYSEVEVEELLTTLGYKGDVELVDGTFRHGFLAHFDDIDAQLCYPDRFRKDVAAAGLIRSHKDRGTPACGVPQGVPLSDLLANVYMFEFDCRAHALLSKFGGRYARYSDDIVIVAPIPCSTMALVLRRLHSWLPRYAPGLALKAEKTEFGQFRLQATGQVYTALAGKSGGFRYLGFRFDGAKVYLRDKTLSNLWRKTAKVCAKTAFQAVLRYPGQTEQQVISRISIGRVVEKTGRVEDFLTKERRYSNWTFWSYAKRADDTFKRFGSGILRQLRNHRKMVDSQLAKSVARAVHMVNSPTWQTKRKKV